MRGFKRDKFTFHLVNGVKLEVKAVDVVITHNDGRCTGYSLVDASGAVPIYINPSEIIAVTQL